jgi:hypothetical protein
MLKSERTFTTTYTGGAPNGIAILRTDGSLLVQPDRGMKFVIDGVAEAVLEENAAYLAWRESQGGTPGTPPEDLGEDHGYVPPREPCDECDGNGIIQKNDYDSFTCPKCKGAG